MREKSGSSHQTGERLTLLLKFHPPEGPEFKANPNCGPNFFQSESDGGRIHGETKALDSGCGAQGVRNHRLDCRGLPCSVQVEAESLFEAAAA